MVWSKFRYADKEYWGKVSDTELSLFEGDLFTELRPIDRVIGLTEIEIIPAVLPKRILCIGLNYKEHIKEMGDELPKEPLVFYKDTNSLIYSGDNILLPPESDRVEYEGELGVVIKKTCYRVSEYDANEYILGYIVANDITARDIQKRESQWFRAKSFKTFCSIGKVIDENKQLKGRNIVTRLNNKIVQKSSLDDMIFSVQKIVSFISQFIELEKEDIILTGTPPGVGVLSPGDNIEVEIDGIGVLRNSVKNSAEREKLIIKKTFVKDNSLSKLLKKS